MAALIKALPFLALLCASCGGQDPAHTEYFPESNGNKPQIFEFGYVKVCDV
jgi:hypothetical protein